MAGEDVLLLLVWVDSLLEGTLRVLLPVPTIPLRDVLLSEFVDIGRPSDDRVLLLRRLFDAVKLRSIDAHASHNSKILLLVDN